MNKNLKLALFLLGATLFNIVLMFVFIIAIFLVASRFLGDTPNPVVYQIVLFVGFIALDRAHVPDLREGHEVAAGEVQPGAALPAAVQEEEVGGGAQNHPEASSPISARYFVTMLASGSFSPR